MVILIGLNRQKPVWGWLCSRLEGTWSAVQAVLLRLEQDQQWFAYSRFLYRVEQWAKKVLDCDRSNSQSLRLIFLTSITLLFLQLISCSQAEKARKQRWWDSPRLVLVPHHPHLLEVSLVKSDPPTFCNFTNHVFIVKSAGVHDGRYLCPGPAKLKVISSVLLWNVGCLLALHMLCVK